MKKILVSLLSILAVLGIAACNVTGETTSKESTSSAKESVASSVEESSVEESVTITSEEEASQEESSLEESVETEEPVELCCAIGDDTIDGKPYEEIVAIAREYIELHGGFEKFAEWGLV